jgi:putative endonuclease
MESKNYYVYILASKRNGTLYVGVTHQLASRVMQHNEHLNEGFTEKYSVHNLVYYEVFSNINNAIKREKQLKRWKREWKIALIEKDNRGWVD